MEKNSDILGIAIAASADIKTADDIRDAMRRYLMELYNGKRELVVFGIDDSMFCTRRHFKESEEK
jgi:hypothetical protein